ncbi:hypothetical protein [Citrobacter braakii]|uniref:hypothetical protein n=1 Tax=Citrobacter braakii TaxID=57706 RepID=UPI000543991B|nr:hypothetical protein [Citrobacter braakii]KHE04929.1 hypothetical protein IB70_13940 [Citrobacter braakii]
MDSILPGESKSMPLESGKVVKYSANRAVNFEFLLTDGTYITGVIPAGETLEFMSNGSIQEFNIKIFEAPRRPTAID